MSLLFQVLRVLCQVLTAAVVLRALASWFPFDPRSPVLLFLRYVTEPVLRPLRRVIPRIGALDITPAVAVVILQVVYYLLP
ncbi:MAG: YggT family protein [Chloroflexota bacterium]